MSSDDNDISMRDILARIVEQQALMGKMLAASTRMDVANYQANKQRVNNNKAEAAKTTKSYELMRRLTGSGPVSYGYNNDDNDDDVHPTSNDHILRMHAGSTNTDSDKVYKSYELMGLLTNRGGR